MLAILFGLPLLLVAPILLIGSQVYQGGIISVDVLEKGPDGSSVSARVPGAVVPVAMMFMPSQVRTEIQCEMGEEMDWAFDVARAAIRSIGRAEDGVYVEVISKREIVRVSKEGDSFKVFVDTPSERVEASMPLGVASRVLDAI